MSPNSKRLERQNQPKAYHLSLISLLSFPIRICNPPPAVGKVRSCGVTPVFDLSLEDVLERKHLPPLGLKDFEEWLLYVELCPENLYFVLWLKEYTIRYRQWEEGIIPPRRNIPAFRIETFPPLSMFYARAKQTFFTPGSLYELDLPSDVLAPFHESNRSAHPDPAVFNEVAIKIKLLLKESLRRFVTAQLHNVGNNRVICGLLASLFCLVVGAILPILYTVLHGHSRWLRISALPGLWLSITLLLTSVNGICLGVYIFGDLRQLKKFELLRPPISKPKIQSYESNIAMPYARTTPIPHSTQLYDASSPSLAGGSTHEECNDASGSTSGLYVSPLQVQHSSSDISCTTSQEIDISPAYYDPDPIEGPSISPSHHSPPYRIALQSRASLKDENASRSSLGDNFIPTASFIPPDLSGLDTSEKPKSPSPPSTAFEFDGLPIDEKRIRLSIPLPVSQYRVAPQVFVVEPDPRSPITDSFTPKGFIREYQSKWNLNKWLVLTTGGPCPDPENPALREHSSKKNISRMKLIGKRFKLVKAVPAFGAPLTRILSPVVVRGQWEIVTRSMILSSVVTWVILGGVLAIPQKVMGR